MTKTWAVRQFIWDRDGGICGLCGDVIASIEHMEVDHIVAQFEGGADHEDNYRAAHISCNRSRGGRDGAATHRASLARRPKMTLKTIQLDDPARAAADYLSHELGRGGVSAAIRYALVQTAKRKGWKPESAPKRRTGQRHAEPQGGEG